MRAGTILVCLLLGGALLTRSADSARFRAAVLSTARSVDFTSGHRFNRWESIEDLPKPLAIYDTVFWEPDDTTSLRHLIRTTSLVKGRSILEIGTGSGIIALCCLQAGATSALATDVNPAALACAQDNARHLKLESRLRTRLVSAENAGAYAVIRDDEKFDLIISNPPWEDARPASIDQYALYDPGFALLDSLIQGAKKHLHPGGKLLLAYGCTEAIYRIQKVGEQEGFRVTLLDSRKLEDLEPVFLPGLLIELVPEISTSDEH